MDQNPVIVDGRTLVPMRAIFEGLGEKVEWNGYKRTVKIISEEKVLYEENFDDKTEIKTYKTR